MYKLDEREHKKQCLVLVFGNDYIYIYISTDLSVQTINFPKNTINIIHNVMFHLRALVLNNDRKEISLRVQVCNSGGKQVS